ncbi:MAG: hypothetical protein KDB53_03550 [Planctomycetes bacterium]|nr:hypothetical protein [Planctomycetota bacterium]
MGWSMTWAPLMLSLCLLQSVEADPWKLYEQGRFEEALDALRQIEDPTARDLGLMGNCAFRLDHDSQAVWYWRRALLRAPDDEALTQNLNLVLGRLGLEVPRPENPLTALRAWLGHQAPGRLVTWAVLLPLAGLALWRRARRLAALLIGLGLLLAAVLVHARHFENPEAVVLVARAPLLAEPAASATASIELFGGETLRVLDEHEGWLHVKHHLGEGYLPRESAGIVD